MKFPILIISLIASAVSPVLANPIDTNNDTVMPSSSPVAIKEVAAMPTSDANPLVAGDEPICKPLWAKCKLHKDCCSCYCAYSVLWGFVCGGNAWTSCKDVEPPVMATAAVMLADSALMAPKVTIAPSAHLNTTLAGTNGGETVAALSQPVPTGM